MKESELWYSRPDHIPVLGHRGISAQYPENTLPSFKAAIELGVDLIEFDVNQTRDGELVVIHDTSIDRTSNRQGLTRDYTLAELKTFDFGGWFGEKFQGETIPTLEQVLALAAASRKNLLLNVEIKDKTHDTVDRTVAMLHSFGLAERSVIACFDAEIIRYTKAAHPEMRTQGFPGRYMENFTEDTYDVMFGMGIPIGKSTNDQQIAADVAFAKSRGILAWLFVADTQEDVRRCVDFGADNITGNNPGVALDTLREMGLHV